jgi:hypothetical protein
VPPGGIGWIDVRDVASAHIAAMEIPEAKGRYIVCSESITFEDVRGKGKGGGVGGRFGDFSLRPTVF